MVDAVGAKRLERLVATHSQRLETLQVSSDWKIIPLPVVVTVLDPPITQGPPGVPQTLTVPQASPLQARIRETASRGEDAQGFQMFPVIEQRYAWEI